MGKFGYSGAARISTAFVHIPTQGMLKNFEKLPGNFEPLRYQRPDHRGPLVDIDIHPTGLQDDSRHESPE
jgi:hypothetical protein